MGYSYTGYFENYDPFWERSTWEYKFAIWPHRCEISKRILWFECAYKGTRVITGPGEPVFEFRWLSKNEYLLAALKGLIKK